MEVSAPRPRRRDVVTDVVGDTVTEEEIEREMRRVLGDVPARADVSQFTAAPPKADLSQFVAKPVLVQAPEPAEQLTYFERCKLQAQQLVHSRSVSGPSEKNPLIATNTTVPCTRRVANETHSLDNSEIEVVFPLSFPPVSCDVRSAARVTEDVTPLHRHSNPVDNSRQMAAMAATDDLASVSAPMYSRGGFLGAIQNLLGLGPTPPKITETRRTIRKRVSIHDVNLAPEERLAMQLWITDDWDHLVSQEVTAKTLAKVGVHYDEIQQEGMGLVDFPQLRGDFNDAVNMGFKAKHMVHNRVKSGPAVLARDYGVTFDMLCARTGLTIDSAVFTHNMNLSDFKLLAPSLENLVWHGLLNKHVDHMKIKRSQLVEAFPDARDDHLDKLFPDSPEDPRPSEERHPPPVTQAQPRAAPVRQPGTQLQFY